MASEVIAFPVNLRRNQNKYNAAYGKYYAEADSKEPLNLKGFAKHISEHGKLVDYSMAVLVLQNIVSCLKEMITQGQPVKEIYAESAYFSAGGIRWTSHCGKAMVMPAAVRAS